MKTKIEWTDYSWNPITGCDNQLPCRANCYARRMAKRLAGRYGYPEAPNEFTPTFHPDKLGEPHKIKKPSRIFVCSMGDLFCDGVNLNWVDCVMETIEECSQHDFIILTKRPDNMAQYFKKPEGATIPKNLIVGTSASTMEELLPRINDLHWGIEHDRKILSLEPLLGEIRLSDIEMSIILGIILGIDGVIVGGETGARARPMHPDWVRKIRDDCKALGIPFFFKGWGEWVHHTLFNQFDVAVWNKWTKRNNALFYRLGKKNSGRLLDGREWNEFPGGADE